jgi:hypothetical protein
MTPVSGRSLQVLGPLCADGRLARCAHPSCELIVRDWCRAIISRLRPVAAVTPLLLSGSYCTRNERTET